MGDFDLPGDSSRGDAHWRTSSFCSSSACLQIRRDGDRIAIRNTTRPEVVIVATPEEFRAWLDGARAGEFDDLVA